MRPSTSLVSPAAAAATPRPPLTHRQLLTLAAGAVFDRMGDVLARALVRLERQLFALAETARGMEQHAAFDGLRQLARTRASILPELLRALDRAVLQASAGTGDVPSPASSAGWELLDPVDVAEDGLHASLAASLESTLHLPLYLLCERMAVVLQRPCDAKTLPIGPFALLAALRRATQELDVEPDVRAQALRAMAAELDVALPGSYLIANALLRDGGVLPQLVAYRGPVRGSSTAVTRESPAVAASATRAATVEQGAHTPRPSAAASQGNQRLVAAHGDAAAAPAPAGEATHSSAHWLDLASDSDASGPGASDHSLFKLMRHLVGGRRALLQTQPDDAQPVPTHAVPHAQLDRVLRDLQHAGDVVGLSQPLRGLVARRLRASAPAGEVPGLCAEHADTVDLVDLLFEHLQRDVASRDNAAVMFARLRVPMLRTALDDPAFFTRKQHPVRRLLDALADASGYWLDDSTMADDPLLQAMQAAVDQVVGGALPGSEPFDTASETLQQRLAERARRAAIIERRHVDAEKGRERLDLARTRAIDAVTAAIGSRQLPPSIDALLRGPWTDAIALAALRDAEDDSSFRERCAAAMLLARRACGELRGAPDAFASSAPAETWASQPTELAAQPSSPAPTPCPASTARPASALAQILEAGLLQVGTPAADVSACVAEHLSVADAAAAEHLLAHTQSQPAMRDAVAPVTAPMQAVSGASVAQNALAPMRDAAAPTPCPDACIDSADDTATCVVDAAAGEPNSTQATPPSIATAALPVATSSDTPEPIDDASRRHLDQLRRLPFGSWFDLQSSTGARRRCRMSWFSPVTGRCLFVNAHGQRLGDFTLQWLAGEMAAERAALVREPQHSVLDGAWRSILGMLRALARPVAGASNTDAQVDSRFDGRRAESAPALV